MQNILHLFALVSIGAAAITPRQVVETPDPNPERYTSCAIEDKGYKLEDGLMASDFVVNNLIPETGKQIRTNYCHYKVISSTIAGVCNGAARNRTVNKDEVRRGLNQMFSDCGKESGYHVVNNLTFSAYGLIGGTKALVPKTFAYPDFPGWSSEDRVIPVRRREL